MYANALDSFVRSAVHGKEIMIIHRVTGGYLTQAGDLQIATDPVKNITDKKHLWVVHQDGYIKNNLVYTFENKSSGLRLSVHPTDPRGEMSYTEAQDPGAKNNPIADRQRFFVLPMCCGGYSLVPVKYPDHCIQPMGNHPQPGCDRGAPNWGGDSNLNCSHDFVLPPTGPPRKDPTDTDLDSGSGGKDGNTN
ncbi:hypothetical protein [Streptomyces sp. NPDC018045]|uniref:hypothetical protein n=1 Tax=Streptomyces sp. NPDC018045 TaxID=3365037 RepID=UPI00379B97EC